LLFSEKKIFSQKSEAPAKDFLFFQQLRVAEKTAIWYTIVVKIKVLEVIIMKFRVARVIRKVCTVFVLIGLLLSLSAVSVAAAGSSVSQTAVSDLAVSHYKKVAVSVKSQTLSGLLIAGTTYIPLRAFGETVLGAKVTYQSQSRTLTVTATGLTLRATDGSYFTEVNGRYLYAATPTVIMNNGRMYVPLRVAAKACGLSVSWNSTAFTATLSGTLRYLQNGSTYYQADAVYWLSRIISAEARGESLFGQIAVGRVVLNRVASDLYPNTIYGVIFDKRYGVQFTPVADGSIYRTPTDSAVMAAKIALEGEALKEPVLFFMEPRKSVSRWIEKNRTYAYTIGNHDFYY